MIISWIISAINIRNSWQEAQVKTQLVLNHIDFFLVQSLNEKKIDTQYMYIVQIFIGQNNLLGKFPIGTGKYVQMYFSSSERNT